MGGFSALGEPTYRLEVAGKNLVPGQISGGYPRANPGLLCDVLSSHSERRADRPCAGRERLVDPLRSSGPSDRNRRADRGIALLAFTIGRYPVSLAELGNVLLAKLSGHRPDVPSAVESVILQVRGPRVLAAALVGAALAFRNPLVSPDILGASSGAALGAVIGIFLSLGVLAIQAFAFLGGLLAVAAVYMIGSAVRSRDPILVLVLTGVVVGALLGAGVGLVKYLADPYNQLPAMTFWLLGSLSAANVSDLLPLFGPVAVGTAVLVALRWRMNVMSLPEEEARSLGVATGPLRIAIVAAATLTTSASVATAGIIGWVGLVVPHLARSLVGPDFARLLPTAQS